MNSRNGLRMFCTLATLAGLPSNHPVVMNVLRRKDRPGTTPGDLLGYVESHFSNYQKESTSPNIILGRQFVPFNSGRLALMSSDNPVTPPPETSRTESQITELMVRIRSLLDGTDIEDNLKVVCMTLHQLSLPSEIAKFREALTAPSERQLLLEIALQGSLTVKDLFLDSHQYSCPSREIQKSLIENPPYFMKVIDVLEQAYRSEKDRESREMIQKGLLALKEEGKLSATRYARITNDETTLSPSPEQTGQQQPAERSGSINILSKEMLLEEIDRLTEQMDSPDHLREIAIKLTRLSQREGKLDDAHVQRILQRAVVLEPPTDQGESPRINNLRKTLYALNAPATRNIWEKVTGLTWLEL